LPIDRQSWEDFSAVWHTDVRASLVGIQATMLQRNGAILEPDRFGKIVSEWVDDPAFAGGVDYGFRADTGIVPMDVEAVSKRT
jgi:hypothetical protein